MKAVWLLVLPFFYFAAPEGPVLAVGAASGAMGLAIRAWAAGSICKDRELATGGPYAYTRNPLYLGSFILGTGVTVAGGRWVFVALFLVFFLSVYRATALREARDLEDRFGDAYRVYAAHVPRFLPRLSAYRSGEDSPFSGGFSLAQYGRNREWEAGLGALAGFGFLALKMTLLG